MSFHTFLTVAGTEGANSVIAAYLLNQLEKLPSTNAWVAISVYGLANTLAKRRPA